MEWKPIAERGYEPKKWKLPEFKILAEGVLDQGDIEWISPVIDIVKIERQGMTEELLFFKRVINTDIKSMIIG